MPISGRTRRALEVALGLSAGQEIAAALEATRPINILDYGAVADALTDTTPAFNAALAAAQNTAASILFPSGTFNFLSKPNPLVTGINLFGDGNVGPNPDGYGTCLLCSYNESDSEAGFLTWTGAGAPNGRIASGAGGGLHNLRIIKNRNFNGGNAVKLFGTMLSDGVTGDDGRRCGNWLCDRVLIAGKDLTGLWHRAFLIDGVPWQTPSGQGIRELEIKDLFASWNSINLETVTIRNTVRLSMRGGYIFPAGSGSTTGLKFTGGADIHTWNSYLSLTGMKVIGTLTVESCEDFLIDSQFQHITVNSSTAAGVISGIYSGTLINNSTGPNAVVVTAVQTV